MNDRENRINEMLGRVYAFMEARTGEFAIGSIAAQSHTALGGARTRLQTHSGRQVSGHGAERQATDGRAEARAGLRERLEAIRRTARVMVDEVPGIAEKFRVPRSNGDQELLAAARAFAADAAPIADRFIAHEMPADFIADLNEHIAALEAKIREQAESAEDHIGARVEIEQALEEGLKQVRILDVAVRNKYANDPATLAEWTSASHVERSPRRKKNGGGSSTPPATPTPSA